MVVVQKIWVFSAVLVWYPWLIPIPLSTAIDCRGRWQKAGCTQFSVGSRQNKMHYFRSMAVSVLRISMDSGDSVCALRMCRKASGFCPFL